MPSNLARFKALLESACQALVDQALSEGTIDFVDRLAAEVPIVALGLLLGLERGQLEPLRAPSDAIIDNGINNSAAALATLSCCLAELVVDRCREPRDDYMTKLARVDFADRPMSMVERIGLLLQIVIGGLETTRSAMAGLLVALVEHRSQWEAMRASPDLVANAVEESLRYVSPINYLRRTTVRSATLGDVTLPAGSRVVVFLGAANRDPARFPQPHELDVRRNNARHHMALGTGPHVCMGAGLAKMELVAFWSAFVSRVTAFELVGPYEKGRLIQQNVIRRLPVRLHAA
jgi:cytochrome P450